MKNRIYKFCLCIAMLAVICASIILPDIKLEKERESIYNIEHKVAVENVQVFEVQYNNVKKKLTDAIYIAEALEGGDESWQTGEKTGKTDVLYSWLNNLENVLSTIDEEIIDRLYEADVLVYYSERKDMYIAKTIIPELGYTSIVFEPDTGIPLIFERTFWTEDYIGIYSEIKAMYEQVMGINFVYDINWYNKMNGIDAYTDSEYKTEYYTEEMYDNVVSDYIGASRLVSSDGVFELKLNIYPNSYGGYYVTAMLGEKF